MKRIMALFITTAILALSACSQSSEPKGYVGVDTLRETYAEEWTKIVEENSFVNLDFSNAVLIPPNDFGEIYDLKITRSDDPICSQAEFVEKFAEYVKEIFPNSKYADDKNCFEFRGFKAGEEDFVFAEDGSNYARVYDNLQRLESGEITLESLLYQTDSNGAHETDEYLWYFLDGNGVKMNHGDCMRNVEKERHIAGWMPRDNYNAKAEYVMPNSSVFKLEDGEITLDDAAEFCNNYFANEAPYSKNSEVNLKAERASVLDLGNGNDAFLFFLTKTYNGIPFDFLNTEGVRTDFSNENDYNFDNSEVLMTKTGEIEYCYLSGLNCKTAAADKLTEVVSLENAVKIAAETLSEYVKFEVGNVSLVYCDKTRTGKNGAYENPSTASAHWKFEMFNPNDEWTYAAYVSLRDGNCFYCSYGSAQ